MVHVLPLAGFFLVGAFTPGPNVLMLAASGANFGFRRTIPHQAGIALGFLVMLMLVSAGIGAAVQQVPALHHGLRVAGSLYLLYLAYRIATAERAAKAQRGTPLSFLEAALFQWLNPKAWAVALTVPASFLTPEPDAGLAALVTDLAVIAAVTLPIGIASCIAWTLFGVGIGRFLADARRRILFNRAMAGLLVLTVVWILFPDL